MAAVKHTHTHRIHRAVLHGGGNREEELAGRLTR